MTRNSKSAYVCPRMLSTASATYRPALYTGIRTEIGGVIRLSMPAALGAREPSEHAVER